MISHCIVVDDEPLAREGIEGFIRQTSSLAHAGSFASALKAIEYLQGTKVDLMFLDIEMPDMTGLEMMNVLVRPPHVIFTTAYREFAVDGFELNAVDYLLKPISYDRFLKAVHKIQVAPTSDSTTDHIFVKCDGMIVKIPLKDILYVETAKDYVFIHTVHAKYMTLVSMRQLESTLPKSQFMRVHRSYLIAFQHVEKIEGNRLHIAGNRIPMSRNLREAVYECIIGDRLIERS